MLKLSARLVRMDPSVVEEIEDEVVHSSPVEVWLDSRNVAALAQAILDAPIGDLRPEQPAWEATFGWMAEKRGLVPDVEEIIEIVRVHVQQLLDAGRLWDGLTFQGGGNSEDKAALRLAVAQVLARVERRAEKRALEASSGA